MRWTHLFTIALTACSSDPKPACVDDVPPAGFVATTPEMRFTRDVMPVFQQACAFSSCHGVMNNPNGVYLGSDASTVYANLVGQRSPELPTMTFVTGGDPRASYLIRKLDGSQCALDAQCTGGSCGTSMPQDQALLDEGTRDVIRRWIAQGAKND